MTAVDRLNASTRLAEAYVVLNKLTNLEDANAVMAKEELIESIKDAEKIIIRESIWRDSNL
jgi:hypothetical protein